MIIELKTLKEIVSLCKLFVVKRPSHQILKYLYLNVEENKASFTTTDLNSWCEISIPTMKTTKPFKACLEVSSLEKGLKAFTDDYVYFNYAYVTESSLDLKLVNGTKTLTVDSAIADGYPLKFQDNSVPKVNTLITREEFLTFFKSSVTAIKVPMTSYNNPVVNSLFLEFIKKQSQLILTGTDGHSAVWNIGVFEEGIEKSFKINIAKTSMCQMYSLIQKTKKMDNIYFSVGNNLMVLDYSYKNYQIKTMCNLYEEPGIDIEKYFKLEESYQVTFDTKELKSCLTFMKNEQAAKFEFSVVHGYPKCIVESKGASQSLTTTNNENNFMFWVNPEKLLNHVQSFPEGEITLTLKDNKSPIIISNCQQLKSLVMPLNPDKP